QDTVSKWSGQVGPLVLGGQSFGRSPVSRGTTWSSPDLSQPNSTEERREPRVRAQVVHERPCLEVRQPIGPLLVGLVERGKCLIPVAEPGIHQRPAKWRHIPGARSLLEILQDLLRFAPPPCPSIRVAEHRGREREPLGN